jgi:D-aminoacyl-tRNA deacylase
MMPQGQPATVLVGSLKDVASRTLAAAVVNAGGLESTGVKLLGQPVYQKGPILLAMFDQQLINPPDLDKFFNPQAYIFLSRHAAESGKPALTSHTTGNFAEAKLGGKERELGRANPDLLKNYMIALSKRKERVPEYQVTVEATHHGPTSLMKPTLFVEIGATERNWEDAAAAKVVAEALLESLLEPSIWPKVGIAFGGTHYPEKVNQTLVGGDMAVAYVAPKYALEKIDEAMVGQMVSRSTSPVRYALIDWKGMGTEKDRIIKLAQQFGLEVVRM